MPIYNINNTNRIIHNLKSPFEKANVQTGAAQLSYEVADKMPFHWRNDAVSYVLPPCKCLTLMPRP